MEQGFNKIDEVDYSDYVIITKADKHYLNITRKSNNRCEQNVRQGVTDNLDQPTRLTYFIPK